MFRIMLGILGTLLFIFINILWCRFFYFLFDIGGFSIFFRFEKYFWFEVESMERVVSFKSVFGVI